MLCDGSLAIWSFFFYFRKMVSFSLTIFLSGVEIKGFLLLKVMKLQFSLLVIYNTLIICAEFGFCYYVEFLDRLVLKLSEKLDRLLDLRISRSLVRKVSRGSTAWKLPLSLIIFFLEIWGLVLFLLTYITLYVNYLFQNNFKII